MWHVEGYDEAGAQVARIEVGDLDPAEFGRALGLVEGEVFAGGALPLTDRAAALLAERLGVRLDPRVEYFAEDLREFPGDVRFGWFPFAASLLALLDRSVAPGGRLVRSVFALPDGFDDDAVLGMLLDHPEHTAPPGTLIDSYAPVDAAGARDLLRAAAGTGQWSADALSAVDRADHRYLLGRGGAGPWELVLVSRPARRLTTVTAA